MLMMFSLGVAHAEESIPIVGHSTERSFKELLAQESARTSQRTFVKRMAGGVAGLSIGLFGYYREKGGIASKGIYSVAQTVSVITISNAVSDYNERSLILTLATEANDQPISYERMSHILLGQRSLDDRRELTTNAYTTLILGLLYAGNAAYERRSNQTLSNAYTFLSANCLLLSTGAFYKLHFVSAKENPLIGSIQISPLGGLSATF
jgi:hypothetical protein